MVDRDNTGGITKQKLVQAAQNETVRNRFTQVMRNLRKQNFLRGSL